MHLYAISMCKSPYVKIGVAKEPRKRLKELQTGNPEKLELTHVWGGLAKSEAHFHNFFGRFREHGEWFRKNGTLGIVMGLPQYELGRLVEDGTLYGARYAHDLEEKILKTVSVVSRCIRNGVCYLALRGQVQWTDYYGR